MKGFSANIEEITLQNEKYRKVMYTGKHSQLVLMCLKPGRSPKSPASSQLSLLSFPSLRPLCYLLPKD
jgi:hypothetical protein